MIRTARTPAMGICLLVLTIGCALLLSQRARPGADREVRPVAAAPERRTAAPTVAAPAEPAVPAAPSASDRRPASGAPARPGATAVPGAMDVRRPASPAPAGDAVVPDHPAGVREAADVPQALPDGKPDPYADSPVIAEKETQPDERGRITRVRIYKTGGKHPFVRVEDVLAPDPVGPAADGRKVVRRLETAANRFVVKLKEGATEEDLAAINGRYGAKIVRKLRIPGPGTYIVEVPLSRDRAMPPAPVPPGAGVNVDAVPEAVAAYAAEARTVEYAGPDCLVRTMETFPNDPAFASCWGLHNTGQTGGSSDADIDAPEAWDLCKGSKSVLVGVIDTGVDYNHPDLAPNIWTNPGETGTDAQGRDKRSNGVDDDGNGFVDDWRGWNFCDDTNDPMDDHFHGTHCAGTIGAKGNNGVGVAGVNWDVSIVPLKFLNKNGRGWASDATEAVYYATRLGVSLTSNSWGGGTFNQALKDAIADAGARGILFVAAAGNTGLNIDTYPIYPAAYDNPNIIAVAASDHRDAYATFSNYGPTSVDLAAPGVSIYSTFPTWWTDAMLAYKNAGRNITTDYCSISGTSMATPHVAGVCALLKAYRPGMSAAQIRQQVLWSTDPMPADAFKRSTQTNGRLNAHFALRSSEGPYPRPVNIAANDGNTGGASGNGDGYINPGERIAVRAPIQNRGVEAAPGVTAALALASADPYVTVVRSSASYGDIAPGAMATASADFLFDVAASTPTPHDVTFTMTVSDSAGRQWRFPLIFTVYNSYVISGTVTLDGHPLPACLLYTSD
ncbi:MAG: S8 family serine peptidase, partial [Planctomycetota bacterium]|nr:S8 family serine peptidase [Planctomycetota bacterium]